MLDLMLSSQDKLVDNAKMRDPVIITRFMLI